MEYLKPIETMQECINNYKKMLLALCFLLGVTIIAVPLIFRNGPYVVNDQESFLAVSKSQPWKITISRIEGFTKFYLSSRFEWSTDDFDKKSDQLKLITSDPVFKKLKDSLSSFKALAQNQGAKCYFVLEGYGFSNRDQKIEVKVTRVLRMKSAAFGTPLIVKLNYQETAVSETNPYGLTITGIDETDLSEGDHS